MILAAIQDPKLFLVKLNEAWCKLGYADERPGVHVDALLELAREEMEDPEDILAWMDIFREIVSWCTAYFFLHEWKWMERPEEDTHKINVIMLSKIIVDSNSVLLLVENGFDSSARQIARTLSEQIDALHYLLLFPDKQSQFLSAQSADEQSKFWWENLSKGKARKAIYRKLKEENEDAETLEAINGINRLRDCEDKEFSANVHPTGFIGVYTAYPRMHSQDSFERLPGFLGNNRRPSVRTLKYCCGLLSELMLWVSKLKLEKAVVPMDVDPEEIRYLYQQVSLGSQAFWVALAASMKEAERSGQI